ncbi:MAG: DUF917 domain-containing protein [Thermoplasmatales archaeon]|nr:DUF917 domain-containing protein [Thermoplasmatales archaeon]
MRYLRLQETLDILYGCAVLASGGGGYLERGVKVVGKHFSGGETLSLASVSEVPSDQIVASPYYAGALVPESERTKIDLPKRYKNEVLKAFEILQDHIGRKFYGCLPIELGGENTAVAIDVAMNFGIKLIDADTAGRSVPEVRQSSFFAANVPITPLSIVTRFGDVLVVNEIVDYPRAEKLIRNIAGMSANVVGIASHPVSGNTLRKAAIADTVSMAERLGNVLRESQKRGHDPVERLLIAGNGYLLFEGKVKEDSQWKEAGGFTIGEHKIRGLKKFYGHDYRIWFKNENMISWVDRKLDVTAPDIITVVDRITGVPMTNPDLRKGMDVAVLGFKSNSVWRKKRALNIISPKSLGFDLPYVPIESSHKFFSPI